MWYVFVQSLSPPSIEHLIDKLWLDEGGTPKPVVLPQPFKTKKNLVDFFETFNKKYGEFNLVIYFPFEWRQHSPGNKHIIFLSPSDRTDSNQSQDYNYYISGVLENLIDISRNNSVSKELKIFVVTTLCAYVCIWNFSNYCSVEKMQHTKTP